MPLIVWNGDSESESNDKEKEEREFFVKFGKDLQTGKTLGTPWEVVAIISLYHLCIGRGRVDTTLNGGLAGQTLKDRKGYWKESLPV